MNATIEDMQILWPKAGRDLTAGSGAGPATVSVNSTPSTSSGYELNLGRTGFDTPPLYSGPVMYRFVTGGAAKMVFPTADAKNQFAVAMEQDSATSERQMVLKYETAVANGITFEGNATLGNDQLTHIKNGHWKKAMASVISGRLKGSTNCILGTPVAWELDVSADRCLCIFGFTLKVAWKIPRTNPIYQVVPTLPGTVIEIEGAICIRFNLTPSTWIYLANRLGVPRLMQAIGRASVSVRALLLASAEAALSVAGLTAGIGATAGLVGFGLGMTMIAIHASHGRRLGILTTYSTGYLVRVFEERTKQRGHLTAKYKKNRDTDRASEFYMLGYEDAGVAIEALSVDAVEKTLIDCYGSSTNREFDWDSSFFVKTTSTSKVGPTIDLEYEEARKIAEAMAVDIANNYKAYEDYVAAKDVRQMGW